ncbi:hypothetical protein GJAV_G00252380 [Gymnothorax javanicus]|nr:hypothetical protein GJAV_G00252380 [Gymnothorax javanicus]
MAAKTDSSEKRNDEASCCEKSWWPLKRYGRFIPPTTKCDRSSPWKIFEPSDDAGQLVLTIVQSGHLLISLGQELLTESRMFRVQFAGPSREEGMELCSQATQRLLEYLAVSTQGCPPPTAPGSGTSSKETSNELPGVRKSSVSVRELAQSLLGQPGYPLPLSYSLSALPHQDLGPFLRLCLLDHSFPALVEEVEKELTKLAQD